MKAIIQKRLAALRAAMGKHQIDAYIIPSSDAHLSEYPAAHWKSRQWISGFTGSAGTVVVTLDKAGLWTDSRYFLQATDQLDGTGIDLYKMSLPETPSIPDFLLMELKNGLSVGLDGQSFGASEARTLANSLAGKGIKLNTDIDLIQDVWEDRPSIPSNHLFQLPIEITGQAVCDKLDAINNKLHEAGADCLILGALDEVAWTFNIRGNDVEYNPVVISYAFVSENETVLFIQPNKLTKEVSDNLKEEGVVLADYAKMESYLSHLPENTKVFVDLNKTNVSLFQSIPSGCKIIEGVSPVAHLKSIKNKTEIDGFRNALVKDGVALTRFYMWLEKQMSEGNRVTEISITEKLSSLRAEQPLYISDSFNSICGYGAHGAIVHYSATPETDATIKPNGLLLMDSGGQYLDGTTDITRTIALGEPSETMQKDFTRVLKGHISLAKCKFPEGTRGSQLDILARKALWDVGINYLHGTGHGIGHCLNVHEGPQSIRMEENPTKIRVGMVMSNEPAMYRTNEYGIRTENMILTIDDCETEYGKFLTFETLTLCFIDTSLVIVPMLSVRELAWLNKYHEMIFELLSSHLNEEEKEWLRKKTAGI